jgi:uncharacterized protein YecT (DUF1311 family)
MNLRATVSTLSLILTTAPAAKPVSWPLAYAGRSTNELMNDKRAAPLIRKHLPPVLARRVIDALSGPPNPLLVLENRYVAMSACVPHFCPIKGFFWLDTKTGTGIGATLYEDTLKLGSIDISASAIPANARAAVVDWLTDEALAPTVVRFARSNGAGTALDPSGFQPRPRYRPRAGGPSFDCASASGVVRKAICADSALSAADLAMSESFDEMRHGYPTMGSRAELTAFQNAWLSRRDTECATASDVKACITAAFQTQKKNLGNWLPR